MMEDNKALDIISANESKIAEIIESKNHIELAKFIGQTYCNFTEDDLKYVDTFWNPVFNKSWIYLSDEIIINSMGYKKSKDTVTNFIKEMKSKYRENIDYKEVDKNNIIIKEYRSCLNTSKNKAYNKKYFIVTGDTIKKMLIRAGTKKGDITCDYFIKIESLASFTNQVIFRFIEYNNKKQLEEKEKQIAKLESKQLKLESYVRNIKKLEKNQFFYIATTPNYARQSRFEYGGVKEAKDLKARLATYNTGRAEGDLYYYTKLFKCNNYKLIEERIGSILQQFKDKADSRKEMIHLRYNLLVEVVDFICENYDRELEYINSKCQEFLNETIESDCIVPEPINLSNYIEVIVSRNGSITRSKKINIGNWDDNKVNELIENIINQCASEKKNMEYNFSEQKNSVALVLAWSLLTPYLDLYNGLSKTEWRDKFKKWFNKEKPTQLTIKGIKLLES